jgi:uncharacterized protein (DUF305 family)
MNRHHLAALALIALIGPAFAQGQSPADHLQHHPGGDAATAQTQPSAPSPPQQPASTPAQPQAQAPMGSMMQGMPEQCRAMMQNMPQGCMGMMQGGMMRQGGMAQSQTGLATAQSEATKAYMAAMDKMHGPMMQAVHDPDPDVAFVRGMIPHHQSAIDMARVVLQSGKDDQAKKWANDVIREQQREIAEMQEWLKSKAK